MADDPQSESSNEEDHDDSVLRDRSDLSSPTGDETHSGSTDDSGGSSKFGHSASTAGNPQRNSRYFSESDLEHERQNKRTKVDVESGSTQDFTTAYDSDTGSVIGWRRTLSGSMAQRQTYEESDETSEPALIEESDENNEDSSGNTDSDSASDGDSDVKSPEPEPGKAASPSSEHDPTDRAEDWKYNPSQGSDLDFPIKLELDLSGELYGGSAKFQGLSAGVQFACGLICDDCKTILMANYASVAAEIVPAATQEDLDPPV